MGIMPINMDNKQQQIRKPFYKKHWWFFVILALFTAGFILRMTVNKSSDTPIVTPEPGLLESPVLSPTQTPIEITTPNIILLEKPTGVGDPVERYGVLRTNSTSGEIRLSYYDMKEKKILESWQGYPWFFAAPESVEHDKKLEDFNNYVDSHKDAVFKIEGTKDEDDCGYYGNGTCLESITVKQIEAVAK